MPNVNITFFKIFYQIQEENAKIN